MVSVDRLPLLKIVLGWSVTVMMLSLKGAFELCPMAACVKQHVVAFLCQYLVLLGQKETGCLFLFESSAPGSLHVKSRLNIFRVSNEGHGKQR